MKLFKHICLVLVLPLLTHAIYSQLPKEPTPAQLGAAWQEYQQAVKLAAKADPAGAEKSFRAALEIARSSESKPAEAAVAFYIGDFHQNFRRRKKARDFYAIAVAIYRSMGNELAEGQSIARMASTYKTDDLAFAEESFKKSILIFEKHNAFYEKARALILLASLQVDQDRFDEAKKNAVESLALYRKYGLPADEIKALRELGVLNRKQRNNEEARQFFNQAQALLKDHPNRKLEVNLLSSIGELDQISGNAPEALAKYQAALNIAEQDGFISEAAEMLVFMGVNQMMQGKAGSAVQFLEKALQMGKEYDVAEVQAIAANGLGLAYGLSGVKTEKTLEMLLFAVRQSIEIDNPRTLALAYHTMASIYSTLGDYIQAAKYRDLEREIQNKLKGIPEKHAKLYSAGQTFLENKKFPEARGQFEELLRSSRQSTDTLNEGVALHKLGVIALAENKPSEAEEHFLASQNIYVTGKNNLGIAFTKRGLGDTFAFLRQFDRAQQQYGESLYLFRRNESVTGEAGLFSDLMKNSKTADRRRLAIFYGKQSVSLLQKLRQSLSSLETDIQKNFIASYSDVYRTLASMLIEDERLTEARQIIALLKEDEYFHYTDRTEHTPIAQIPEVAFTPEERQEAERYNELTAKVSTLSGKITEIESKKDPTGTSKEDERKLNALNTESAQLEASFVDYLRDTAERFAKSQALASSQTPAKSIEIEIESPVLNKETVLLTVLTTENHTYLILTSPSEQISRRIDITSAELKTKINGFREVLYDPRMEPMKYAQYFHKLLFEPIAEKLQLMGAKTILLSLDGDLRYVPFAALHDGEKFLVERFTMAVITLVRVPQNLTSNPQNWRGIGAGVSQSVGGFPALPFVAVELQQIIRDEKKADDTGIFPGRILLDQAFTRKAISESLNENFDFALIATHFDLRPGKDRDTFLLLGDGKKLDLATLRTAPDLPLKGIKLLALTGCNTGFSSTHGNGAEVESLAVLAQKRGASSVLASLWAVDDNSTAILTTDFFKQYQKQNAGSTDAQVLRSVQIAMLNGRKFSHPYFWSPFILLTKNINVRS